MLNAAQRDAVQEAWMKTDQQTALDVRRGVVDARSAVLVMENLRAAVAEMDAPFSQLLINRSAVAAAAVLGGVS